MLAINVERKKKQRLEQMQVNNLIQIFRLEDKIETIDLEEIYFSHREQDDVSSHQKILDYLQLEKTRQDIGEKGEQYVYEREKRRLLMSNSTFVNDVSREPAKNPKNGYDILSFTESGEKIYIEVKSTKGHVNEPFYMTANEREKANQVNKNGGIYQIHRVFNVDGNINCVVYEYDEDGPFCFEEILYRVTIES